MGAVDPQRVREGHEDVRHRRRVFVVLVQRHAHVVVPHLEPSLVEMLVPSSEKKTRKVNLQHDHTLRGFVWLNEHFVLTIV